ncbi:MAG TPA: cytochrome c oxidase subunit II [Tepidisphaeraceae bacterium]|jgi:cytochrome c oxidase subunit 2|nr:cytochrome c oxidase subunit II [Tepidisphaeraceae bacterium]
MLQAPLAAIWLPDAASKNAAAYDPLFYFILGVNVFFSSLIMAMLIFFVFKYRHREGRPHDPTAGHSTALELTWTIIPTMLVLVIFYFGFRGYLHANPPQVIPNADSVTANGAMWNWTFTYANNHTDPELHLVVNKPTNMELQSADVIHDLDIPAFRMKKDVVPGRYNKEWFEPTVASAPPATVLVWHDSKPVPAAFVADEDGYYGVYPNNSEFPIATTDLVPGESLSFEKKDGKSVAVSMHYGKRVETALDFETAPEYAWKKIDFYDVYCAMYCGTGHSIMLAKCIVQTQDEFDRWMAHQIVWEPRMSYVDRGKELAGQMGCVTCHSHDGAAMTGPTWKNLYGSTVELNGAPSVLADDAYIEESILLPSKKIVKGFEDKMPQDFGTKLKPNDITALTWYMKSISANYKGDMKVGLKVGAAMKAGHPATQPTTVPAGTPSPTSEPPAVTPH